MQAGCQGKVNKLEENWLKKVVFAWRYVILSRKINYKDSKDEIFRLATRLQDNIKMHCIRQGRKLFGRTDGDTLFPPGFARNELAGRLADPKLSGYKCDQVLIGFTIDRRGLDSQL